MGAGIHVGRVGSLAVFLGIGAAVITGHGVASAQPADTSGSQSSSTESSSSGSSTDTSSKESTGSPASSDASDDAQTSVSTDTSPASRPRSHKRWRESKPPKTSAADRAERSTEASRTTNSSADTSKTSTSKTSTSKTSTRKTEESDADDAPTAAVEPSSSTTAVAVTQAVVAEPETTTVAKKQPNDAVSVAVSSLVTALVSPFAGKDDEPTAPVDSPAIWTLAAAARREFLGSAPALDKEADPSTNGLVTDNVTTMAAMLADDEEPQVVAIPQGALLTPLQYLPVIGPWVVRPVVALLHQIPLIGDILHPIIGYPVGFTGGTTPRDVRVISEDGTSDLRPLLPGAGRERRQAGADDPQRSGPGPSRRDQSPRPRQPVAAQSGHRHGHAAEERLQRRHMGPAR